MSFLIADRVKETTTSTGTGNLTLAGAMVGFQSFAAGIGNGNQTFYTITDGIDWEVGSGTYFSSGTVLIRDAVIASSNSGSKVNWGAGEKQVFVTYPAAQAVYDFPPNVALAGAVSASGALGSLNIVVPLLIDFVVIAGGGGGGSNGSGYGGGGGGAGGYRASNGPSGGGAPSEAQVQVTPNTPYTVTVGAGGPVDSNGSSSVFSIKTAIGGGAGGLGSNATPEAGSTGGSGGGGGTAQSGTGAGGAGTTNQGYAGGTSRARNGNDNNIQSGGGGGAGEAGQDGQPTVGGKGGDGVASSITGTSVIRAGGGGGSTFIQTGGAGGAGGGGTGGDYFSPAATAGTANTGGGGGGTNNALTGTGGSGVVILKYPDTFTISNPAGGLTFTTSTAVAGYKITTFTAGTGNVQWS